MRTKTRLIVSLHSLMMMSRMFEHKTNLVLLASWLGYDNQSTLEPEQAISGFQHFEKREFEVVSVWVYS